MDNFKILLKKNFLEFKRTKKWIVFLIVFPVIAILSSVLAKVLISALAPIFEMIGLTYEPTIADSYAQFVANMAETGYLLIAIMFSVSLVKEKSSSTYYVLKSNGVKESDIVLSHFVSKLILITASYLASVVVFVVMNLILFRAYTGYRGVVSLSFTYLLLVFALCFSLFVSSFVNKKSHGYIIAIASYFVFSILYVIPKIDVFTPFYALTLSNDIMYEYSHNISDFVINGVSLVVICIGLIIGSIYLFKNKVDNGK